MESNERYSQLALPTAGRFISAVAVAVACATPLHAAVVDADPSNYQSLVSNLGPGDTLRLSSGVYLQGLSLAGKAGTAARPIIVTGPEDQSAVFRARDCCNTVQLDDTSFVQVANLTLDGGGRDGLSGVASRGNSHHITLENLRIFGHNGSPHTTGISAEGPSSNWVIRHDVIVGAGTGLHLGSDDGAAPFVAGLIENNVVLGSIESDMDIAASGSTRTIIRNNVFGSRSVMTAGATYESYGNTLAQGSGSTEEQRAQGTRLASVQTLALSASAAATPTLTLTASPTNVASGGSSTLTWSTTGADGCSASGGWSGTKGPSGSQTVGPIQATTSYQLTCLGAGGNANAIAQVTVGGAAPSDPPMSPSPTPTPTDPPSSPTPTNPPPQDPTPVQPSPPTAPAMGDSKSGGGSFDWLAIAMLAGFVAWQWRRSRGLR